jgi:RNA polymerase sigma factor for flagellar operon FliA
VIGTSEAQVSQAPANRSDSRAREHDQHLYERYMPLVRRIAMRTIRALPATITFDDILSAGWVGMAEALTRRTSEMEEEHFEAYASYRVRGAILDYLRVLDPLSRKLRGASRRITEAVSDLTSRHGRMPSEDEVAAELGLSLPAYQELLGEISDAGFARLELSTAMEPASAEPSPETAASRSEMVSGVANAIDELPERLRLVLSLHYQDECSLREIGEVLGVTESRVCQLHAEAVHLIRARLEGRPRRMPALSSGRR